VTVLDRRALAGLVLVVLVAAGASAGLVRQLAALRALRTSVAREQAAMAASVPAPRPVTADERLVWQELADRLRRRFPAEPEVPDAMRAVAEWARAAGLELLALDVAPAAPAAAGPAPSAPGRRPRATPAELTENGVRFTLVARHRYGDLLRFVDGLERLPVYVAIESLDVRRTDSRLTSEVTFVSLRWGA
jgi:hypothetical protein